MSVRSAEQSASRTRTSHHELSLLSLETLVPLPVKSLMPSFNSLHDPAVLIDRLEMSGEKKRKVDINLRGYKCGYLTFCPNFQKFSTFPKPVFEPQKYD